GYGAHGPASSSRGEDGLILSPATDPLRGGPSALWLCRMSCENPARRTRPSEEGTMSRRWTRIVVALGVVALLLSACGGKTETPKTQTPQAKTVGVALKEWAVAPAASSVAA